MSSIDINNAINNMQNATSHTKAKEEKVTGTTDIGQDAFLMLMIEQLKAQDPLSPMDNSAFLQQQAMFNQVSELQKLNNNLAASNNMMQACALIGKEVAIQDPNNPNNIITGVVTEVNFSSSSSGVVVNGKIYSISDVIAAANPTAPSGGTDGEGGDSGEGDGETGGSGEGDKGETEKVS